MTYHRLETKEGDRFYREAGAGEPIVLLHCSSGSSGAWALVMNHLGQDYRVLAPDLLGYGRSAPWQSDAPLGSDAELGIVGALLNIAGRPAHLVGHSYGGTVALRAARRFPRQVASLTLIEPVAFNLLRRADAPDGWREIAALAERHLALVGEGRDAAAAQAFVTYWTGPKAWQQMPDTARDSAVRSAVKVAAEWQFMFAAEDDRDAIAGIGVPTLLICGGRTRMPARRVVEVLRRALPHALHNEIADAGHMSPLTHPRDIAEAIRRHVDSINAQRRSAA
jgi:pimeloyl-ACP methyl ester carboxylesterase